MPIQYDFVAQNHLPPLTTFASLFEDFTGLMSAFVMSQNMVKDTTKIMSVAPVAGRITASRVSPVTRINPLTIEYVDGKLWGASSKTGPSYARVTNIAPADNLVWGAAMKMRRTGSPTSFTVIMGNGATVSTDRVSAFYEGSTSRFGLQSGSTNLYHTAGVDSTKDTTVVCGCDGTKIWLGLNGLTPISVAGTGRMLENFLIGHSGGSAASGLDGVIRSVALFDACPFVNGEYSDIAAAMSKV